MGGVQRAECVAQTVVPGLTLAAIGAIRIAGNILFWGPQLSPSAFAALVGWCLHHTDCLNMPSTSLSSQGTCSWGSEGAVAPIVLGMWTLGLLPLVLFGEV